VKLLGVTLSVFDPMLSGQEDKFHKEKKMLSAGKHPIL
jgi:hypothetical protein